MRLKRLSLLLFLLIFLLCSCKAGSEPAEPSPPPDAPAPSEAELDPEYPVTRGGVTLKSRPGTVISLSPAITEKLCDLGYESRIAGISDYCDYPMSITSFSRFGTAQLPDIEEIVSAKPQLVFSSTQLSVDNTKALSDAGIAVAVLPHSQSLAELEEIWLAICMLMDGETTGFMIGEKFVGDFEDKLSEIAAIPAEGEPKPAVYLRMLNYTIATGNTLEGELLERIGFINIAAGQTARWSFDPQEAQSPEGRALFESIAMIFCDERDVSIKMLEQSDFYRGLNCVLKDLYIYIDCAVFERQSLRMLEQLEIMAGGK